jgi:hypothetical protein
MKLIRAHLSFCRSWRAARLAVPVATKRSSLMQVPVMQVPVAAEEAAELRLAFDKAAAIFRFEQQRSGPQQCSASASYLEAVVSNPS